MTTPTWPAALRASLAAWLGRSLTVEQAEGLIPASDPLRVWWSPDPRTSAVARLVALLCEGGDHLSLLALVQRARTVAAPAVELEDELARQLDAIAAGARSARPLQGHEHDAFLSYAHEDTARAVAISRMLAAKGARVFRDVEQIQSGESITTRLNQVMSSVKNALLIVSRHSLASEWVERELRQLLARHRRAELSLLPVLIDDVPLPPSIADVFTIDLRGYRGSEDDAWAQARLEPLVRRLRAEQTPLLRHDAHPSAASAAKSLAGTAQPMSFVIERSQTIFDDFFRIDEAHLRHQRFDGTMSGVVRRLSFVRGDSVAAILVDRRRDEVILIRQFRYPTCASGSGWTIEAIAGTLEPGEAPEAAMRREIEEEVGYRVDKLARIASFFVSPGGSSERIHLFHAEVEAADQVSRGGGLAAEGEDIQTLALPIRSLPSVLADGTIADAKTLIGLQWLLAGNHPRSEAPHAR